MARISGSSSFLSGLLAFVVVPPPARDGVPSRERRLGLAASCVEATCCQTGSSPAGGLGAIMGPLIVGLMMDVIGDNGFWLFTAVLMLGVGVFGMVRATQRDRGALDLDQVPYAPVSAGSSAVAVGVAQEVYLDAPTDEIAARAD